MDEKQELLNWLEKLKARGILILVEGKKDRAALNGLGIANVCILEGPLYKCVEELAQKTNRTIILTDLDKEGRKLYGKLKKDLSQHGVQVDDGFREFLFRKTNLRQIEGLGSYLENLEP